MSFSRSATKYNILHCNYRLPEALGTTACSFIRCLLQARVADKPVVIVLLDSVGKMTRVGDAQRIKRWMESASLGADRRKA